MAPQAIILAPRLMDLLGIRPRCRSFTDEPTLACAGAFAPCPCQIGFHRARMSSGARHMWSQAGISKAPPACTLRSAIPAPSSLRGSSAASIRSAIGERLVETRDDVLAAGHWRIKRGTGRPKLARIDHRVESRIEEDADGIAGPAG